ncbi:MAG TPA: putative Ig domain-containing protein, partial [Candidatus Saccharimonadales bacterium]|nr:putative Ig domain-containing protein [Candidatus Saccharimonadales bacterium]
TYDSQHRVLTSTTPLNETTTYVYDVNGNLVHQTDADGYTQSWTYNYFKQVQTHTDESGATYTYTYDASSGLMTAETSNWTATGPSGSTTSTLTYSYEASGALAGLTEVVTSGSSSVTSTYGFSYDANGNETLETISTQDGGGNAVKTQILAAYDSHNRLQEVTDENTAGSTPVATMRTVYVYDADGNRRAVFASSAYDTQGTSSTPIAATPIPLTTGAPTLGTALANQTVVASGAGFAAINYSVASSFTDPLGMGLTYTATGLPSWLSLNGTSGVFSGTPSVPTAAGSYTVTVTAMDVLGRSVSGSFTVTVPAVNPVFTSAPANQTAIPGSTWSYQAPAATDANGYGITYSISGSLPPGVSFNASTRTFSGTPSTGSSYSVTYTAKSSAGTATSVNFTINVPNVAPTFTGSVSNQTLQPGGTLNYQAPAATDANGYGVTYSVSGLPSGISFNASTRTFTGSLTTQGNYNITYTATATTGGQSVSQTFTITVPSVTPVFSGGVSNQAATVTLGMSYQAPAATDANGASISYSASGMPPGIGFNASTRTFSGTPTTAGTWTVTYVATASTGQVASTTFTITVNPASAPIYNNGSIGEIYWLWGSANSWQVPSNAFTNPMGRSLSYSVSGALPPYTTFSGNVLTYSPPSGGSKIGHVYSFTLTATDPVDGLSVSHTLTVDLQASILAATPAMQTMAVSSTASIASPASSPVPSPAPNVQADWFTYDADGRVLVADGALQNGQVVITSASNSAANTYDAAGDLATYTTKTSSGQNQTQKNIYNALGQLTLIEQVGSNTSSPYETRNYDADGRLITDVFYNLPNHIGAGTYNGSTVTFNDSGWVSTATFYTYNADGELTDQSQYAEEAAQNLITQYGNGVGSSAYATQDQALPTAPSTVGANVDGALYLVTENSYTAGSGYGYDADGNLLGYHTINAGNSTVINSSPTASTAGYQNTYIKQNSLLLSTTTEIPTSGSNTVIVTNTYNDLGELAASSGIVNGAAQSQSMAYTSGGQLLQKGTSSNGNTTTTTYESVNENELDSVDTAGTIDVLSTTGGYSNSDAGTQSYTVHAGDTLQTLAQAIYGDSSYYYILAQANGLSPTATLPAGMVLKIPQVTTSANASNVYQPYAQGSLLSASTTSLYTTAQIIAMSIDAVLNRQSALAQTVAEVEKQQDDYQAQLAAQEQAIRDAQNAINLENKQLAADSDAIKQKQDQLTAESNAMEQIKQAQAALQSAKLEAEYLSGVAGTQQFTFESRLRSGDAGLAPMGGGGDDSQDITGTGLSFSDLVAQNDTINAALGQIVTNMALDTGNLASDAALNGILQGAGLIPDFTQGANDISSNLNKFAVTVHADIPANPGYDYSNYNSNNNYGSGINFLLMGAGPSLDHLAGQLGRQSDALGKQLDVLSSAFDQASSDYSTLTTNYGQDSNQLGQLTTSYGQDTTDYSQTSQAYVLYNTQSQQQVAQLDNGQGATGSINGSDTLPTISTNISIGTFTQPSASSTSDFSGDGTGSNSISTLEWINTNSNPNDGSSLGSYSLATAGPGVTGDNSQLGQETSSSGEDTGTTLGTTAGQSQGVQSAGGTSDNYKTIISYSTPSNGAAVEVHPNGVVAYVNSQTAPNDYFGSGSTTGPTSYDPGAIPSWIQSENANLTSQQQLQVAENAASNSALAPMLIGPIAAASLATGGAPEELGGAGLIGWLPNIVGAANGGYSGYVSGGWTGAGVGLALGGTLGASSSAIAETVSAEYFGGSALANFATFTFLNGANNATGTLLTNVLTGSNDVWNDVGTSFGIGALSSVLSFEGPYLSTTSGVGRTLTTDLFMSELTAGYTLLGTAIDPNATNGFTATAPQGSQHSQPSTISNGGTYPGGGLIYLQNPIRTH